MICGGLGLSHIDWARNGYVAITLLPALGIHLVVTLANKKQPVLVGAAYTTCAAFALFYLVGANSVTNQACYANYAVFSIQHGVGLPFAIYYYGWMLVGSYLAWRWGKEQPKHQKALSAMALGYMAFILPTTLFNIIDPTTISGIPSIMCGFAVLFAATLVLVVLPNSVTDKQKMASKAQFSREK